MFPEAPPMSLVLAALVLSVLVVRLPGPSCFSAATPLWLWSDSPWHCLGGLTLMVVCQRLMGIHGRQGWLDPLAGLVGLSVRELGPLLWLSPHWRVAGVVSYLLLVVHLRWRWSAPGAERVSYLRLQRPLRRLHAVTALAVLAWQEPLSLSLLPLLLSSHWAAANERFRVQAQIDEELLAMQGELRQLTEQRAELLATEQQRLWLERLSHEVEAVSQVEDWLLALEKALAPLRVELLQFAATRLGEPLWEPARLSLPLQPGLTLEVTRQVGRFDTAEVRAVVYAVRRAWPALGRLLEQRKVGQLQALLNTGQRLTSTLAMEALLQVLPEVCSSLVDHRWGLLCTAQGHLLGHWGEALPSSSRELAQRALHSGAPLLQASMLAFPLGQQPAVGALVLGLPQPASSEQQQVLEVLAQQVLAAWLRAQALEQLRQAQQQLVLSGKMIAVGGLAAGVAHELNSPLGAIALMVDSALRQLDRPEQARSKLERAQQACERARLIVQRLLEEARHPGPLVQPFRLDDCLREGLPFVEEQLNRAGVELVTCWSQNPTMQGQSSTVQQVMINLLLNAAEAVGPGGRIELATHSWGFSVSDWGPGIPEEVAERIFEPFFTTRSGGNGLGLWICQDLLRQQQGTIRLVQGRPTRFEVHLMSAASGKP